MIKLIISFTGMNVFGQGYWKQIQLQAQASGEANLLSLVETLKRTALMAKAEGTVTNYSNSLKRWIEFAKEKGLVVFPASVIDIAMFFLPA